MSAVLFVSGHKTILMIMELHGCIAEGPGRGLTLQEKKKKKKKKKFFNA